MVTSLPLPRLAQYLARQINTFFPDGRDVEETAIRDFLPLVMEQMARGMAIFRNSYFWKDGQLYFDHLHGDQYASFLYRLGHVAGKAGPEFQGLAVKTYLLNKALHGLDAFYQVALPESCWLAHPVGTVIGRATFGGPLVVMQGCTIGNRASKYPTFGKRVIICAQSTVIGECHVGDDVCIGAGCLLVNTSVPSGSTVVGRGQDLRIMTQRSSIFESVFLS